MAPLAELTDQLATTRKALDHTRLMQCRILATMNGGSAADAYEAFVGRYPTHAKLYDEIALKAVVAAGTTTDAAWAAPLAAASGLAIAFKSVLDARAVVGRLPGLNVVPFNVPVLRE